MRQRFMIGVLLVSLTSLTLLSQTAMETYQRALVQEQAAGNLKEAIDLYRQAAREATGDRNLAGRSLLRAAGAEEKLADPHAAETYAEILSTFAEQREQVATAQARLTAIRVASGQQPVRASTNAAIPTVVDRTLQTYCMSCHSKERNVARLDLETMASSSIAENAARWETLLQRLRARLDPPAGMPRPDDGTFQTMISTLEVALDQAYPQNAAIASAARVNDTELAERMAVLIWGKDSSPDEELLNAARRGALRNPGVIEQQVRRMLRDSRSSALAADFFEKWMLRNGLDALASSTRLPSELDEELRQSLATETRMFLESQIRDDRNALDLWTANYTFVNERLARLYGVPNVSGSEFRRVTLPGTERAGIVGQASFLTVTSMADRTSPTVRGTTVLRLFTGITPPNPPPNVPAMAATPSPGQRQAQGERTLRERLVQHTSVPACVSCHRIFDPWGLVLENFDRVGALRRTQGGVTIDTSGAFIDGTTFAGPADFRAGLLKYRDAYYTSITQSLLGFALGRQGPAWRIHENEMPAVRAIVRSASASDYRWSAILAGIVSSPNFQLKTLLP